MAYTREELDKMYEEFEEGCRAIAEQCETEGYPSHGSNYDLRVEALQKEYPPELFMTKSEWLEVAVLDWVADHEEDEEYKDLVIELDKISFDPDSNEPYVPAHDTEHEYALYLDKDGNVRIVD